MKYTDENRGKIHNRERGRQVIDFSRIRYGNVTPTDIDGFIEKADTAYVFYELKYLNANMPRGQETALTRMVDALSAANKKAVFFLCRHSVFDTERDIDAAESVVDRVYFNGQWHPGNGRKLKDISDAFMKWALPDFAL